MSCTCSEAVRYCSKHLKGCPEGESPSYYSTIPENSDMGWQIRLENERLERNCKWRHSMDTWKMPGYPFAKLRR